MIGHKRTKREEPRPGRRRKTKVDKETVLGEEPRELVLGPCTGHSKTEQLGREDVTQGGFRAKGVLTLLYSVTTN